MNPILVCAAILVLAIGAAHSYLGERYLVARLLRRDNLPRLFGDDTFTRRTIRFAWHLTTIAWWGIAALVLTVAAGSADLTRAILAAVAVTFLLSAALSIVITRARHLSWIVFLAIAALCVAELI